MLDRFHALVGQMMRKRLHGAIVAATGRRNDCSNSCGDDLPMYKTYRCIGYKV